MTAHENHILLFIRRIMRGATEAELQEATETFMRYMEIVIRIHERAEENQEAIRQLPIRELHSEYHNV
ncbi:hypothetical protein [Bradyrhizobium diazoefficiens]|uniref:Uncharacterized protein n=1 Tax=Bradyrhizobium diazoefficiens TaxID=1355477 RepID=A0A809Z4Q0_9BRAD|nr:hypothetical protein XF1B_28930 [Bradyrhizobium diazoefficiens]BCE46463.1 hypothetical protein XF4B_28120 [Bradyrhizobium diazoefficiens]BCE89986.1 hypothetical protein XF10B_27840 [Bradyrhizobium diazoefficiens]BCF24929.1 hypothetical protein XF14B_28810 [Bradyrhizobium diazoefficiens]